MIENMLEQIKRIKFTKDVITPNHIYDVLEVLQVVHPNVIYVVPREVVSDISTFSIPEAAMEQAQIIALPYGLKTIPENAMSGCTALELVLIPETVESIEANAFYNCTSLKTIRIPERVTTIGNHAFYNCTSLTSVTIPDSVTTIGDWAFDECSNLTSIEILNSVTSIGNYALSGCTSLTDVEMGNKVTSIGAGAFSGCTSLMSVTIPDSVTSIGNNAFAACTQLEEISLPFIGQDRTTPRPIGYLFSISNDQDSFGEPDGNGGVIITDNSIKKLKTVEVRGGNIADCAFKQCADLTKISITGNIGSIGEYAFLNCPLLESVNVKDIATWCNITLFNFSSNPLYYDKNLYFNEELITDLNIPNSVTSISKYAFYNYKSLTSVTIPNSVTSIGDYAFEGCSNLTSVHITDIEKWCGISFSNISANPLYYAHSLYLNDELITGLVIPDSVTSIGGYVFCNCTSLTSVTIPNSVTSIDNNAFYGCPIENATIPTGTISSIPKNKLKAVTINGGTSIGNSAFSGCTSLTSVAIPNSVTSIGNSAFSGCTSLMSVTIPDSITSISNSAFRACKSLTSVTIPDSVITIGERAFYDCTKLVSVAGGKQVINIRPNAFTNTGYYKNKSNWLYCGSTYNDTAYVPTSSNQGNTLILNNWLLSVVDRQINSNSIANWSLDNALTVTETAAILPKKLIVADEAFKGLSQLSTIKLPGSHHNHDDWSSSGHYCSWEYAHDSDDDGLCDVQYSGDYDPETGIETPIYCEAAFAQCECIRIGERAFQNCYNLDKLYIPCYVREIGEDAFDECGYLFDQYREIATECCYDENGEWCGSYIYEYEIEQQSENQTKICYANSVYNPDRWDLITNNMGYSKKDAGADAKPDMDPKNNGTNWQVYFYNDCDSYIDVDLQKVIYK